MTSAPSLATGQARPSLLEIFKAGKKPENFWFRIYYGCSTPLVWLALRVGLIPNQLTVAGALINVAGMAYFMCAPTDVRTILTTYIVLNLGHIFDCADGQLAFVGNLRSDRGYWLDSCLDIFKSAYLCLIILKTIYTQGHVPWTSTWLDAVAAFAAVGNFVNYAVSMHALQFRDRHDGYKQTSFEKMPTKSAISSYLTEMVVSHLREYGNFLLAFALFAVSPQIALVFLAVLGISHWIFSLRRVFVIAKHLQTT